MPGRFFQTRPVAEVARWMGVRADGLEEVPRRNIAPGQEVVVCTAAWELRRMRWGIIPVGRVNARGRPVMETIVNARSETVFDKSAFEGVGRALVPVEGWYEWTGKTRRKTAWRIRPAVGGLMVFAAITDVWTAPGGREVHQVATVTCEPSGDVRAVHDRMGVILAREAFPIWLEGSDDEAKELMRPAPEGSLVVERADDVDWGAV